MRKGNLQRSAWALALTSALACSTEEPAADDMGTGGVDPTVGSSSSSGEPMDSAESSSGEPESTSGPAPECTLDEDCQDGTCLEGSCCALESVCNSTCCGEGEFCLFGACTVPGNDCTTEEDCSDGEYCELGLGEPGGGMGTPPGPGLICTQELPPSGACVAEPETCDDPDANPDTCLANCEFEPEPGQLDTTIEWQWGLMGAGEFTDYADVWSTPAVARVYDANCDGRIDINDPPSVVFVSGNGNQTYCSNGGDLDNGRSRCQTGILRVLDGTSGAEIFSLDHAADGDVGFSGVSVALGDITGDGHVDIAAVNSEGYVVVVDRNAQVVMTSDQPLESSGSANGSFGWGGALAIGDLEGDGSAEIAYGRTVFTTAGGTLTQLWVGESGRGGDTFTATSFMVDLNGDGTQELLAGNTAYNPDGSALWYRDDIGDGFNAVADLDKDGVAEVIVVRNQVFTLDAVTGADKFPPAYVPGNPTNTYLGGPPTVADFDGDTWPEIGIAGGQAYVMYKPNLATWSLDTVWEVSTKDTSSHRTGSSVFDFEGDGQAEVVYSDECFLYVLDGTTGSLRYAAPNTTFTATESLIVADVDGDAHAEIVRVSNSANWDCDTAPWNEPDAETGRPAWEPPNAMQNYYRGITLFGDAENSWVGTRTLWNQHAYFVSNVCDGEDGACEGAQTYGELPAAPLVNWTQPWLNNFRQNVQDSGLFNAPDPTVALQVKCAMPLIAEVSIRNSGLAPLQAGVEATVINTTDGDSVVGTVVTTDTLLPGQTQVLDIEITEDLGSAADSYQATLTDLAAAAAIECNADNNASDLASPSCVAG